MGMKEAWPEGYFWFAAVRIAAIVYVVALAACLIAYVAIWLGL